MNFSLLWRGYIPSDQGPADRRSKEKQEIRLMFSNQLRKLWRTSPQLSQWQQKGFGLATKSGWFYEPSDLNAPFFRLETCGFDAIPLVTWHNQLDCELEVRFIGEIRGPFNDEGDLDNRLKVLLDALRIPRSSKEVPGNAFGSGHDELFCLLEDDSLVRKILLEAVPYPGSPVEYSAEIKVRVVPQDGTHAALELFR